MPANPSKNKAGPSAALKLELPRKGWKIKELEVIDGELHLRLFQPTEVFQVVAGGAKWDICDKELLISVSMDLSGKQPAPRRKHSGDVPLIFQVC